MSYSASLEDNAPSPYKLKVMTELFAQARILGLDLEELLEFLASQVQAMLSCPPNYNFRGEKKRIWVLRGFYPKSTLFFKLTICHLEEDKGYYAKASPMRVSYYTKHKQVGDHYVAFDGIALNEALTNRMENTFFGAAHVVKDLLPKEIKMPRCMSPKGMRLLRYQPPRKRRNAKPS